VRGFAPQIVIEPKRDIDSPARLATLAPYAFACSLFACSSSESGTIQLVTGQETDTFTQAPAPVTLEVSSIDSSGTSTLLKSGSASASTIDLGSVDPSTDGIIQVSGFDAANEKVLGGQSVVIAFGGLDGATLPLFVQRTGEMARLPNPPTDARPSPVTGVIAGRYVVVTGGADPTLAATTMIYDLANLAPVSPAVTLPLTPTSMAFVAESSSGDPLGWFIDNSDVEQFDFETGVSDAVTLPTGFSVTDISGGATVSAPDGSQYIVGATRAMASGGPTKAVLALDPAGNPSWLTLAAARVGAAATWVPSVGLVVTGGNAGASGAEVITVSSASTGSLYAFPADPSMGSGAAALDGSNVLIAGGLLGGSSAGVRVIDLSCTAQCTPTRWQPLGATLEQAQVFAVDANSAVVVGSEPPTSAAPGLTHVYRVTSSATTEVPTKVAHTNAAALASPIGVVGSVLVVGGAPAIESLGL
jgi:hypothetical protein